jgi:acetoin utilization protein AcuB
MAKKVVTVAEDTPIEEAARIMADNKIGGLPVVRGTEVVGMVTETDLFKVFLELLGAREAGVRLSALVADQPGELAKLTSAIFKAGGNILALGTFLGESTENRMVTAKVEGIDQAGLRRIVEPLVERIVDLRTTRGV